MAKILKSANEDKSCYIEELPDEILGDIVSRLSTNEAARASAVSRRWRNASASTLSSCRNLDFDFTDKSGKKRRKYNKWRSVHRKRQTHACTLAKRGTDSVMKRYQGLQLDNLRIAFHDYEEDIRSLLDLDISCHWEHGDFLRWFEFANAKQVVSLDIDIESGMFRQHPSLYRGSQLKFLPQEYQLMSGLNSWDRLTTLSLKSVIMLDDVVQCLLSNSPNLETLLFNNVPFTKLQIKRTNPKLRRLEILHCAMFRHLRVISAPNLESLKHVPPITHPYERFIRNLNNNKRYYTSSDLIFMENNAISGRFKKAPKLEDIYLGGPLCPNLVLELHKLAPRLRKLQLYTDAYCHLHGSSALEPFLHCLRNLNQVEPT